MEVCDCYHGTAGRGACLYTLCDFVKMYNCEILCTSVCMCNLLDHLYIVRPRHTVLLIGFPVIRKAVAGVRQRKEVVLTQGPVGTLLFLCGVQGLGSWSDRNSLSLFFHCQLLYLGCAGPSLPEQTSHFSVQGLAQG